MKEIPVSPDVLAALGAQYGYVWGPDWEDSSLSYEERVDGWTRAERIIGAWAKTDVERAFLEALAGGHEIAEARRLSGISRAKADALLRRIRGESAISHKRL